MINIGGQDYDDFRPYLFFDEYYCVMVAELILPNKEGIVFTTMLWESSPSDKGFVPHPEYRKPELEKPNPNSLYQDSSDWGKAWGDDRDCEDGDIT